MITINGAEIEVLGLLSNGFDITLSQDFTTLIQNKIGLSLPMFKITFSQSLFRVIDLINRGQTFTYRINDITYNLVIMQYDCHENLYTIYAYLNIDNFVNIRNQSSNQGTSIQTLQKLTSISVKNEDNVDTSDSQIWIQPNITDKEYCRDLLNRSYLSDDDFIVYYIDLEGNLELNSYSNLIEKDPVNTFGSFPGSLNFNFINTEGIPVNIYDPIARLLGISTQAAYTDNYDNDVSVGSISKVMINAGNCNANYFNAPVSNLNNYVKLYEKLYNLKIKGNLQDISPLDTIKITDIPDVNYRDSEIIDISLLVVEVDTYIAPQTIEQTIFFAGI